MFYFYELNNLPGRFKISREDAFFNYLSDRKMPRFLGPDADTFVQIKDEYLAVADLAGLRALNDGFNRRIYIIVVDGDLQLCLL